ncbi:AMP-activated serine/threonine-protein kinase regulatory subunit [Saccharomycopsis crataegensis]|uniref:AMP-activated serine/threonine-protein kinase regulatory subunit n=1 Tax=Saccharomycopsis crataegensis TaxID=43959 RepID=A0AAV5QEQ2_9ASCO|nr:AMP-activated serine/threonine-protein kinase regulatory subunit [Saccharomycopsis crataegensis]
MSTTTEETEKYINQEQHKAIQGIRLFLKSKSSYDVLPVSFRLIVLDTSLSVKKSLNILLQNSIVSAPLWNNQTSRFAGLLTSADFINVIQYYLQNLDQIQLIDQLTLNELKDIEKAIGLKQIETSSIPPFTSLFLACEKMLLSNARRIPLIDEDKLTHREIIVNVLTQYRILKFVSLNCKEIRMLMKPLKDIKFVSDKNKTTLVKANLKTPILDVIHILTQNNISAVPIVDENDKLINVYEAVDVLGLIKAGIYNDLSLTVGEALMRRSDDFEGVYTCTLNDSLATIMSTIKKSKLHRLFIVNEASGVVGVLTLSDILRYLLFSNDDEILS